MFKLNKSLVVTAFTLFSALSHFSANATLIINEVLSDPASGYDANGDGSASTSRDEFIEFVNTSSSPLNISGWTVSDASKVRHTFAANTVLAAGQAIVLFGGGTPTGDFAGALTAVASTNSLSLNNSGDTITVNDTSSDIIVYSTAHPSDQSETRSPDLTGSFASHKTADTVDQSIASPGTKIDGSAFVAPSDTTAPTFASGVVAATKITLRFDENLDSANTPVTSEFTIKVNGSSVALSSVDAIADAELTMTLSNTVNSGETVTVSYSGSALRDASGNKVASFTDQSLTNTTGDSSAPVLQSATLAGATLTVKFNEALDPSSEPAITDFIIKGGAGGQIAVRSLTINNTELSLNLQAAVPAALSATFNYSQSAKAIQDASANKVASFSGQSITNTNLAVASGLLLNEINADPDSSSGDANGDGTINSSADEFLEFINVSGKALDVSGWTISDKSSSRHTIANNTVLDPGQALVVFGAGTPTGDFAKSVVQVASSGSLGLNNSSDTITVNDGSSNVLVVSYSGAGSNQSITLTPESINGSYAQHETADTIDSSSFSPGTQVDGNPFIVSDVTAPTLLTASAEGTKITLSYSENLSTSSVPATNDFAVTTSANGSIAVSSVAINGKDVMLSLAGNVGEGTIALNYVVGNAPLQDTAGNNTSALSAQVVANNTDNTAPQLVSAIVYSNSLILKFDEALDSSSLPQASDFQVTGSISGAVAGSSVAISDSLVTVSLVSSLTKGEVTSFTFTNSASKLRDNSSGLNPVVNIASFRVGNTTSITPVINEFIRDQSGDDDDEFVEILTTPKADMSSYSLLQIELDLTSNVGSIDRVTALGQADDLGFIRVNFSSNIENGNVGLFLVEGFTGAQGNDIDSNNDEVIDNALWTKLHDSIAVADDSTDGAGLAQSILFPGFSASPFEVGGASRRVDGLDTDTPADWVRNDFSGEGVIAGVSGTTGNNEAFNTPGQSNRINVPAPANQPSITMPAANEVLTGSTLSIAGLTVAESDNVSLVLQLFVSDGSLTINNSVANGANAHNITGNGTNRIHIAGTVAQINATLAAKLLYQAPNSEVNATLTATVTDGLLSSDTKTMAVNVTNSPTNFPTQNTVPTNTVAAASGNSVALGSGISVADAGGSGTYKITITSLKGVLTASAEAGVQIAGSGTSSITFESSDLAAINRALNSLVISANGFVGATILTVASSDGIGGADSDSFIVNFTAAGTATDITIEQVQGSSHSSGLLGRSVTVTGEVTATKTSGDDGFYLQAVTDDGNLATSSAIFVYTVSAPTVSVGNRVTVTGVVAEDINSSSDISETRLTQVSIDNNDNDSSLDITPVVLGDGGRAIPTNVIEDDNFASFDISADGIDFFESIESMLVAVNDPVAISTDNGDDFYVVADNGNNATGYNAERSVLVISGGQDDSTFADDDFNPEKIKVSDTLPNISTPSISPGDKVSNLTGIMSSDGDGFALLANNAISVSQTSAVTPEVSALKSSDKQLTIGGMNLENLDPSDSQTKFDGMADAIVNHMNNPDIIALQEVQDNSGSASGDNVTSASQTAQKLIDAIAAESKGANDYAYFDFHPVIGEEGGQPGGNIRVGYLFRTSRVTLALPSVTPAAGVTLVDGSGQATKGTSALTTRIYDNDSGSDTSYTDSGITEQNAFKSTRIPASANFTFTTTGETITLINVHFSSRGGSDPLWGSVQPPQTNENKREAQAHVVRDFVESILSKDSAANVIVVGDYNTFGFSSTVDILERTTGTKAMHNLEDSLAVNKRFSFEFGGNAQTLDHMLVSNNLFKHTQAKFEKVHVFVGFEDGASDHDPLLALFNMELNSAPTISGTPSTSVRAESDYSFTPNATDANGDNLTFAITNKPSWANFNSATGALTGRPTSDDIGNYANIVISVSDGSQSSSLPAFSIDVANANQSPIITGSPATSITVGQGYSFTPSASDDDGDALNFSIGNAPSWTSFDSSTGSLTGTPSSADIGTYANIRITVSDNIDTDFITFSITVEAPNQLPIITGSPESSIQVGDSYSFTPSARDADGDSLTFTINNKPSWAAFDSATGALTGTPKQDNVASYSNIEIAVSDGKGTTSLPAFAISVEAGPNIKPIVFGAELSVDEDQALTDLIKVIDNNKDELTLSVTKPASHGSVAFDGLTFTYTPNENFHGQDNFSFVAADNEFTSEPATISIIVNPINDAPQAADDNFVLPFNAEGTYNLDVLSNDSDIDQSTGSINGSLVIQGASADIGSVTIVDGQLSYVWPQGYFGDVNLTYSIRDNEGLSDSANVQLTVEGLNNAGAPVITVPEDVTVDATGLFTPVNLGVATAVDAKGNPIAVSLVESKTVFAPGSYEVFWQAKDAFGAVATASQAVNVNPLVSFVQDQVVAEGTSAVVKVVLNGKAPVYPLTVGYKVEGTADEALDHNATSGSVTFENGATETDIVFEVFADEVSEESEKIVFVLDSSAHVGVTNQATIDIVETNIAPEIVLTAKQANTERLTVAKDQGLVEIVARVADANPEDILSLQWQSSTLANLSSDEELFSFDPALIGAGVYSVTLNASDNGSPSLDSSATLYLEVVTSLGTLSAEQDSDGDLIPDAQEGYLDSDGDGIPDYLDAISQPNVMPQQAEVQDAFLIESESGVSLRRGVLAQTDKSGGLEVSNNIETVDTDATNVGGVFDFILQGLKEKSQSVKLVLPQLSPIPANAIYRKYKAATDTWVDFVTDANNQIYSATGAKGVCPPPGDSSWSAGLTEGHWCVQLKIEDGGPNDDDGQANKAIVDPGGVGVRFTGNNLPVANDDNVEVAFNSKSVIDVLENDTDEDNDSLGITSAQASLGTVTINDDATLTYQVPLNMTGLDTITYGITDGNGGSGSATVNITVLANQAPKLAADQGGTHHSKSIELAVLANDTDPESDKLSLVSASANEGKVSITAQNTLMYTPELLFAGVAKLSYSVTDGFNIVSATVTVNVTGNTTPVANQDTAKVDAASSVQIQVLANDSDADGDKLTVTSATAQQGNVKVDASGVLTYTAPSNLNGSVTINYTVEDEYGATASSTVLVQVSGSKTESSKGGSTSIPLFLLFLFAVWTRLTRTSSVMPKSH